VQDIVDPHGQEASIYVPWRSGPKDPRNVLTRVLGACYFGDFDAAHSILTTDDDYLRDFPARSATEDCRYHKDYHWRIAYLRRLLETDRSAIPQLLHDWEAFTVNALKLAKYWKPTPFPCDSPPGADG
jgi:hypothetical protein